MKKMATEIETYKEKNYLVESLEYHIYTHTHTSSYHFAVDFTVMFLVASSQ
jgi:hypothetical protein